MQKNILLVDDHAVMRNGLRLLLEELDVSLQFFEAADGDAALEILRRQPIDVVILDIHLGETDSVALVELLSIRYPQAYILIFSMLPEKVYGRRFLQAGARSYLPKSSSLLEIRRAFELVLGRKTYMSQEMIETMAGQLGQPETGSPFDALSRREFEIATLVLSGETVSGIAQKLNVKPSTVGTYKSRIFEKLRIKTLFQLKDLAMLYNLPSPAWNRRPDAEVKS
ncbi:response regulator [Flaviaesturariibacter aridisoli]|uniref:Response regulator transcription factor n=1 Tax=Flaviaesturariibacter aridisoli TaxID=2545761 RepID=A0A4V2WMR2_9BACT|nr:response regulator transcription factor [Flaviaesturariibacter aridisoli]TCZ72217.1 response regulator transcription factor [Flaviaesturariibacter aridisoli]